MNNNITAIAALLLLVVAVPCTAAPAQIAFQAGRDGAWNIYVINDDGTNERQITFTSGESTQAPLDCEQPAFSRDGSRIAFAGRSLLGDYDIWVVNADGSNMTRLTDTMEDDRFPAFSPDGSQIVFQRGTATFGTGPSNDNHLYVMDSDTGRNVTLLTGSIDDGNNDMSPEYFPDGSAIAFARDNEDGPHIYRMDLTTGVVTKLTRYWGRSSEGPTISPDGSLIAVAGSEDQIVDGQWIVDAEIFLMPSSGLTDANPEPQHVTDNTVFPGTDWAISDAAPSWSLDSQRIAFQGDSAPNFETDIYTINADGTGRTQVTSEDGMEMYPSYGPPADPASIDDCKKGLWEAFGFKNQGRCIQFVNTSFDSR